MRIFIVGGGKLAYYLIKTLKPGRHDITVIELEKTVCERMASEFEDVRVFQGDGTSIRMLEQIDCQDADFYVAVTGKDENNLVGCEVAKKRFGVRRTVARVNNPKNVDMFNRLGIDRVYSSTQLLADIIEQEIDFSGMRTIYTFKETGKTIVEFALSEHSSAVGQTLLQYDFPRESKVVMLTRPDGTVEMPRGDLLMKAGDMMILVCDPDDFGAIWKSMVR